MPDPTDLYQAWELVTMMSYGVTLQRVVVAILLTYYLILFWLIFSGV
ncbi:MAG: hypothetical protein HOI35_18090 [Woeseia sp.]|nr:hypothetical protein [Woeseia sp.]